MGGVEVTQRQSRGFRQVPPANQQDHPVLERPGDGSIGQGRAIDQVDVLNRGLVVAQGFLGTGLGQQASRLEAVRSANPLDIGRVALGGCGGGNPSRVQPGLNLWNRGAVLGQALLPERLVALKHQRSQAQRPLLIVISPVDDRTGHGPRPGSDTAMQVSVEFQLERFPQVGQERIIEPRVIDPEVFAVLCDDFLKSRQVVGQGDVGSVVAGARQGGQEPVRAGFVGAIERGNRTVLGIVNPKQEFRPIFLDGFAGIFLSFRTKLNPLRRGRNLLSNLSVWFGQFRVILQGLLPAGDVVRGLGGVGRGDFHRSRVAFRSLGGRRGRGASRNEFAQLLGGGHRYGARSAQHGNLSNSALLQTFQGRGGDGSVRLHQQDGGVQSPGRQRVDHRAAVCNQYRDVARMVIEFNPAVIEQGRGFIPVRALNLGRFDTVIGRVSSIESRRGATPQTGAAEISQPMSIHLAQKVDSAIRIGTPRVAIDDTSRQSSGGDSIGNPVRCRQVHRVGLTIGGRRQGSGHPVGTGQTILGIRPVGCRNTYSGEERRSGQTT